jgi:DNA-binding NarL/FixJ family response regulator
MVEYTVVIVDRSPLIAESFAALCQGFAGCRVLGHCSDGEDAWMLIERLQPDIAVIDLHLQGTTLLELLHRSAARGSHTKIVALALRADQHTLLESIRGGARGFILKSDTARHFEDGLRLVLEGSVYVSPIAETRDDAPHNPLSSLSAREQQVFSLLVEGTRAREIARLLSLSPKTVDTYRASLMRKLCLHDTTGLVKFAIHHKITRL